MSIQMNIDVLAKGIDRRDTEDRRYTQQGYKRQRAGVGAELVDLLRSELATDAAMDSNRRCFACGVEFPISEFPFRGATNVRGTTCTECLKKKDAERASERAVAVKEAVVEGVIEEVAEIVPKRPVGRPRKIREPKALRPLGRPRILPQTKDGLAWCSKCRAMRPESEVYTAIHRCKSAFRERCKPPVEVSKV